MWNKRKYETQLANASSAVFGSWGSSLSSSPATEKGKKSAAGKQNKHHQPLPVHQSSQLGNKDLPAGGSCQTYAVDEKQLNKSATRHKSNTTSHCLLNQAPQYWRVLSHKVLPVETIVKCVLLFKSRP